MTDTTASPKLIAAIDSDFKFCDKAELREHCKELGIPVGPNTKEDAMRVKLLAHYGKQSEFEPARATARKGIRSRVLPPVNLIFEKGQWGGRRHAVTVFRPKDEPDIAGGFDITVNGYAYPVVYGELSKMPEPHYLALKNMHSVRGRITLAPNPDGGNPLPTTTLMSERRFSMDYVGVVPETAHLPGSLVEYYNGLGQQFFEDLDSKQVRELCMYIGDIPMRDKMDREFDAELLRSKLIAYFFPEVTNEEYEAA